MLRLLAGLAMVLSLCGAITHLLQKHGLQHHGMNPRSEATASGIPSSAEFTGSAVCAGCHGSQQEHWQQSDHSRAMEHANPQTVLGNFQNSRFDYFGRTTRFTTEQNKFWVTTENQQGKPETFEVVYTLGYQPLQQYLVKFPDGRIQALPFAWDTRPKAEGGQRWFHLYPADNITAENPLFWTRSLQNWNHMCADCHTTGFSKNFSDTENAFHSEWKELANGCESCHGPGSAHVDAMKNSPQDKNNLFILGLRSPSVQMDQCGVCHARRDRLQEKPVQEKLLQTWRPELLHDVLYFHDGQIQDEVFEVGSFMQSKMYAAGVTCTNCHDPHTTKLKAEGNALCTQCHSKESYDTEQHHFHPPDSAGSQCVSCHMPERTYMGVDVRHDHRFSLPRPDLSEKLEAPNTCTTCHVGKSNAWAAQNIDQHLKEHQPGKALPEHFGLAFWQARRQQLDTADSLQKWVGGTSNSIVKATALVELGAYLDEKTLTVVRTQLSNADPLIRLGAVQALGGLTAEQSIAVLVNHLQDDSRGVRLAMAPLLASADPSSLTATQRKQFDRILLEYRHWLESNLDRADALVSLAGLALAQGDVMAAQKNFEKALQRDETSLPAYLNYADFYRSLENDPEAEKLLRKAIKIYPDSADVRYSLGLLLVREKKNDAALRELKQAMELAPGNSHYAYVYAVGLHTNGQIHQALSLLAKTRDRFPANGQVQAALQAYCAEPAVRKDPACTP